MSDSRISPPSRDSCHACAREVYAVDGIPCTVGKEFGVAVPIVVEEESILREDRKLERSIWGRR